MKLSYLLDGNLVQLDSFDGSNFGLGEEICLSKIFGDPFADCAWYERGFQVLSYESILLHSDLIKAVELVVKNKIVQLFPGKSLDGFSLELYHQFVNEQEHRYVADPALKRLWLRDLVELSIVFVKLISRMVGSKMSFARGNELGDHWIILRINPPCSFAYNPPHKDIYEDFDRDGICPQMVNLWIPVAGVNCLAGLGVAPGSHLLDESVVLRSRAGSFINSRSFSVNCIKEWDGSTSLETIFPSPGEMLCFSSHLIHGLGINRNANLTRVALEFRLHKQNVGA